MGSPVTTHHHRAVSTLLLLLGEAILGTCAATIVTSVASGQTENAYASTHLRLHRNCQFKMPRRVFSTPTGILGFQQLWDMHP